MRDAVICSPLRTAIGRYGGALRDITAADLATTVTRAVVERNDLDPAAVEDVILGHCYPNGDAPAIGRVVALDAGLPLTAGGLQVDRRCGSGLQAVLYAAMQVQTGASELLLAGGTESMSNVAFYSTSMRWGLSAAGEGVMLHDGLARGRVTAGGRNHVVKGGMLETAENLRREYAIGRDEQDELALHSHRKAVAAQQSGVFAEEIVPVTVTTRKGSTTVDTDEHPRADTSLDSLAALKPVMLRSDPDGTVTAGNASGQNDAASVVVVCSSEAAAAHGLTPLVRLAGWALAGVAPETMGIGPVPATAAALAKAGLSSLDDVDVIELNEAFAAQVLAVLREWDVKPDDPRLNPHGSGISLGHPVGATGARILTTLSREMARSGKRWGLETMCIGGGQGLAAVWELVA